MGNLISRRNHAVETDVNTDFVYIATDQERKLAEHTERIMQERKMELLGVNRMTVSRAYAIRHVRTKSTSPVSCDPLGMSLCTGILRYIITSNYDNITRYIRLYYFMENDAEFNTFLQAYGKNVKSDELLPHKTIQDMMLSHAEKAVVSACSIGLTVPIVSEVIWMTYTCLHNALPPKPGKKLFKFMVSVMYSSILAEWASTVKMTKNVILGRLPQSYSDAEDARVQRLQEIKNNNAVDAKFGDAVPCVSMSGPSDTFEHRQRILEERLYKKRAVKSSDLRGGPGSREAFNKNKLRLERVVSMIIVRRTDV